MAGCCCRKPSSQDEKPPLRYKAHPDVDSCYAVVVVISSHLLHIFIYGFCWSTGVYNAIFLRAFGEDKMVTAWAGTLTTASMYGAGPVSSFLTNRYGCRLTIMAGGLLAGVSISISYFTPNIYFLYFSFGILAGFGFGLAFVPAVSAVSMYTDRCQNFAMGLATCGVGVGTFLYPPFITVLEEAFSWRDSLLIMGAITFNMIACGALMRPIKRTDFVSHRRNAKSKVDLTPLKNVWCLLVYLNNFLICFAFSIVYVHLVAFLESRGVSELSSSYLMSAIGISCMLGRVALASLIDLTCVNAVALYVSQFLIGGLAICLFPLEANVYVSYMLEACFLGFFTASYGSTLPAVLIRVLGKEGLASGYGYLLIFSALGQMLGGPFAGFLYDKTSSYSSSFFVGGVVCIAAGLSVVAVAIKAPKADVKEFDIVAVEEKLMHASGTETGSLVLHVVKEADIRASNTSIGAA